MSRTNSINRANIRWQLLASASAAALLASAYGASEAQAAGHDGDRPLIWIELGGQLDRQSDSQEPFNPPFLSSITQPSLVSALNVQHAPDYALDSEGKLSFQPDDSNWVFSASVRYGRSHASNSKHQQTPNAIVPVHSKIRPPAPVATKYPTKYIVNAGYYFYPSGHVKFAEGSSSQSERHLILDFQAGKDVGLGMFGGRGSSVISAGVRIAQFTSKAAVNLRAEPDVQYPTAPISTFFQLRHFKYYDPQRVHDYSGVLNSQRSFHGIGPSLSWAGSAPVAGDSDHGEIALDWGINGAVLFGRQEARGHHETITRRYYGTKFKQLLGGSSGKKAGHFIPTYARDDNVGLTYYNRVDGSINRSRSVTVPNLGGFAGLSFRYSDAEISIGYRADFFFGAVDGGIDTRKSENRGFFGPFASLSVGIGD